MQSATATITIPAMSVWFFCIQEDGCLGVAVLSSAAGDGSAGHTSVLSVVATDQVIMEVKNMARYGLRKRVERLYRYKG